MSRNAKRKRKTNAPRPNSKTFWIQRGMGIFLLVLILGILIVLAVNFFKEAKQERRLVSRPHEQALVKQNQNLQASAQDATAPKYTFSEELNKRNQEIQIELQQKIAQADKTNVQGRHYRIQIGAFNDRQYADQLRAKMILRDYPVQIINDGNLYLVQVGPYSEREEALKVQTRLQREGIKDHVLKAYVK